MSNYKRVLKHLNKEELSKQNVELAMDFSAILKELTNDVSKTRKQSVQLQKLASSFVKAKNPDRSGVYKNRQQKVNAFYKDFSKKAADLGIDVKSTQFYKEFDNALDLLNELRKLSEDIKASIKAVR